MSQFLRDLPHLWHGHLKLFVLIVGLLCIPPVSGELCQHTRTFLYYEHCFYCNDACKGYNFVTKNCPPGEFATCTVTCSINSTSQVCCPGFWGSDCNQECPGGSKNFCNGHGGCIPRFGQCVCSSGFAGLACELCTNPKKYGPSCSLDCKCENGDCNNGIHGNGLCSGDNPCQSSVSPCGNNSQCTHTGAGKHRCVCHDGYAGDGTECAPINPCQNNNGGCDNTTDCIYTGPKQHKCQCKMGYEGDNPDKGCTIKDMCSPGLCGPNAVCETREPLKHRCVCNQGYSWNGAVCIGNIIEILKDLNTKDTQFKNQLQYMVNITTRFYGNTFASHAPITIFVPTDQAFRNVMNDTQLGSLLGDANNMQQILRQHIAAGRFMNTSSSSFYNLQGNLANLETKTSLTSGNITYFTLSYENSTDRDQAEIIESNLEASNGIIHIIDTVMGMKDAMLGDEPETVLDLMNNQPDYSTMYSMIMAAGLSELFSRPNTTVLISNNTAWDSPLLQAKYYLMYDTEGRIKLDAILKNHVFPGVIDVIDLINTRDMKSYDNVNVKVQISNKGQIQLDGDAIITKANILVKTGLCHHVDKVMVPAYLIPLVNNTYEVDATEEVQGPCTDCNTNRSCPLPTDTPSGYTGVCYSQTSSTLDLDWGIDHLFTRLKRSSDVITSGCFEICLRKVKKQTCSEGFYGRSCIPCPGGFINPCSGNGNCSDGDSGTGECSCTENYLGTTCNRCVRNDTFGPHCNETCTCQFGQCDTGTIGTGRCKPGTCQLLYTGENCDKKLVPCESDDICHVNFTCVLGVDGFESCHCLSGYEDGGNNCLEIDFCADERNPCHQQATCSHNGPGAINCTCNNGWHGDGFQCMPNHPCDAHTDCHKFAVCIDLEPGQHRCECKTGYSGNGRDCKLVDLCVEDNGGCHPKAQCTVIKGERNCTCPEFMIGDGITCLGTIAAEIMIHPRLNMLRLLLGKLNIFKDILQSVNASYTFFAPSDSALKSFLDKLNRPGYFYQEAHMLAFIKFHTVNYVYLTEDMMVLDGVMNSYPTLYDGFSLRVVKVNSSLHIYSSQSKFAVITEADIPALNGYFHIIDQVLEPFLPDGHELPLANLLSSQPQYQLFYKALQKTNVLQNVSSLHDYTLFVLPNDVVQQITRTITADFLKFYVVPKRIFTPSMSDGDVDTVLGSRHKLAFRVSPTEVLVNNIKITRPDILTDVGVIHELAGALHPVLNRCGHITSDVQMGPCGDCSAEENLTCPEGFTPHGTLHFESAGCLHQYFPDAHLEANDGCQLLCERSTHTSECCFGFYGPHCDAVQANCTEQGGCHPQAICTNDISKQTSQCECNPGFHGNGTWCQQNSDPCSSHNGGCDLERAVCSFTEPKVTDMVEGDPVCGCKSGYVGDGKLCSTDLLDAISRIPLLSSFYSWLLTDEENIKTNITELFGDRRKNMTVFVFIKKLINNESFAVVDGIFRLPNYPGTEDQLYNSKINITSKMDDTKQRTETSISGQVINVTLNDRGECFVNGAKVVRTNILALNGILHLIADPLATSDNTIALKPTDMVSHPVIAGVTATAIVVLIALIAIVIYKKRFYLYIFRHQPTAEHSSISFSRITSHEDDSQSIPDSTQYENPLFHN